MAMSFQFVSLPGLAQDHANGKLKFAHRVRSIPEIKNSGTGHAEAQLTGAIIRSCINFRRKYARGKSPKASNFRG